MHKKKKYSRFPFTEIDKSPSTIVIESKLDMGYINGKNNWIIILFFPNDSSVTMFIIITNYWLWYTFYFIEFHFECYIGLPIKIFISPDQLFYVFM